MNIVCSKKILNEMIGKAQKAISQKTTMEALTCLLVEATTDTVHVTGYDMEMGIIGSMAGKVEDDCKFIVNSRLFGDIVRRLPEDEVNLTFIKEENKLHINSGSSNFSINTGNADEYPSLPKVDNEYSFKVNSKTLKDMISKTVISLSTDMSKIILTGALLEVEKDFIAISSIDGYRLSHTKEMLETGISESKKIIIPGKILNTIHSTIGSLDTELEIMFNEKVVGVKINDIFISGNLLEGDFIDYNKLLPKDCSIELNVNRNQFLNIIDRACAIASNEKNSLIKLSIEDNKIKIIANSDLGGSSESVTVEKVKGDSLNIAFNARYLSEALKVINSDEIVLRLTTNVNPSTIQPKGQDNFVYLVLPVRVSTNS